VKEFEVTREMVEKRNATLSMMEKGGLEATRIVENAIFCISVIASFLLTIL